jgi:hypothetical protein
MLNGKEETWTLFIIDFPSKHLYYSSDKHAQDSRLGPNVVTDARSNRKETDETTTAQHVKIQFSEITTGLYSKIRQAMDNVRNNPNLLNEASQVLREYDVLQKRESFLRRLKLFSLHCLPISERALPC